ncbi:AraC family transcriptional regulator [Mannheimia haemolytica USDA-ARS-USMARC-185]|uniref:helix-turn-helix transcriptional regulator n=1 Tax=Mannheimia haemolytica TaxID=75985 RepID=UPI0002C4EB4C|nr:AraC family transcriptional regulator [Mannheimia haemolytica]AGI35215.1 AraC family transcriptional regulator [Mannheimia haemolytica USDA-ARS-USMARC-185]
MMKTILIDEANQIKGFSHLYRLRSDLMLKYTEISVTETVEQEPAEFEAGLRLVILLSGRSEIDFNSEVFELDASLKPQAAFLPLNRAEMGRKIFRKGQLQKELVIFLYPKWLIESQLNLASYHHFKQHLKAHQIILTQSMLKLIHDIVSEQEMQPFGLLEKEGNLLALLASAFSQLTQAPRLKKDRVQQLTELLESGKFDGWSLKQIAIYFHTNVTTLQNEFQHYHKTSILAYLRRSKLEQAYKLLLQGQSITQAAEFAGYANSENFSTAFKRTFGITPSQIKRDKAKGII